MKGLEKNGFVPYGQWELSTGQDLQVKKVGENNECPCLYAFTVDKKVVYIGLTTRSMNALLSNYLHFDASQKTIVRIRGYIREILSKGGMVEILILVREHVPARLSGFGFPEELKKTLLQTLNPPWNCQYRQK